MPRETTKTILYKVHKNLSLYFSKFHCSSMKGFRLSIPYRTSNLWLVLNNLLSLIRSVVSQRSLAPPSTLPFYVYIYRVLEIYTTLQYHLSLFCPLACVIFSARAFSVACVYCCFIPRWLTKTVAVSVHFLFWMSLIFASDALFYFSYSASTSMFCFWALSPSDPLFGITVFYLINLIWSFAKGR